MAAAAFAAVAALEVVLFGKTAVAFWSEVIIAVFQRNFFLKKTHITKIAFSYLVLMFVVVNKFFLAKQFDGVTLWPFIVVRREELKHNPVFINHEKIHLKQQLELLIVFFFIWYFFEYFIRLVKYRDSYKAYSKICFEREAYSLEKDLGYLKKRKFWAFWKYL